MGWIPVVKVPEVVRLKYWVTHRVLRPGEDAARIVEAHAGSGIDKDVQRPGRCLFGAPVHPQGQVVQQAGGAHRAQRSRNALQAARQRNC